MTKKQVFVTSGIMMVVLVIWEYVGNVRWCTWGEVLYRDCLHSLSGVEVVLIPILPLLLLSLITYKMREEVFRAWWNFARWMLPVIMIATLLINLMPSNRGFFNMDALVYLLVLAPLYAIFILVSLWKIVRTYRKLKKIQ
jgi:succinate dehydrogenase/fumarate reductase cytochrome b subunit